MRELRRAGADAASGALGISSETCAAGFRERCTAINAPPAEMFRALANSRNSLPAWSWLRTKTGMASGKRGHSRRSIPGFRRSKRMPLFVTILSLCRTLGAKHRARTGRRTIVVKLHPLFTRKRRSFSRKPMFLSRFLANITAFPRSSDWKSFTESGQCFAFFVDTYPLLPLAFS